MIRMTLEADTPDELAATLALLAGSVSYKTHTVGDVMHASVAKPPIRNPSAKPKPQVSTVPERYPNAVSATPPTVKMVALPPVANPPEVLATRELGEPVRGTLETAETPVAETAPELFADTTEAADLDMYDDFVHGHPLLIEQRPLVMALLQAYVRDCRMNTGRLYECTRRDPGTTQRNLREVRIAMVDTELLATKGKRSPHNVTPSGKALLDFAGVTAVLETVDALADAAQAETEVVQVLSEQAPAAAPMATAPVTAPAPEAPSGGITIADLNTALVTLVKQQKAEKGGPAGVAVCREIIRSYGAECLSQVPEDKRGALLAEIEAMTAPDG